MVDTEKSVRILTRALNLVLFAYRAEFQKGKPCMHGQYHDAAQQNEQHITA